MPNTTSNNNGINHTFDVYVGIYDGAEICELISIYIINELTPIVNQIDIGSYGDDGQIIVRNFNRKLQKNKTGKL